MKIKQKAGSIIKIQFYHRLPVRILLILTQENKHYNSDLLMKKSDSPLNINKIMYNRVRKIKVPLIYQKKKRVNPHSQHCAHHSRFRPS